MVDFIGPPHPRPEPAKNRGKNTYTNGEIEHQKSIAWRVWFAGRQRSVNQVMEALHQAGYLSISWHTAKERLDDALAEMKSHDDWATFVDEMLIELQVSRRIIMEGIVSWKLGNHTGGDLAALVKTLVSVHAELKELLKIPDELLGDPSLRMSTEELEGVVMGWANELLSEENAGE